MLSQVLRHMHLQLIPIICLPLIAVVFSAQTSMISNNTFLERIVSLNTSNDALSPPSSLLALAYTKSDSQNLSPLQITHPYPLQRRTPLHMQAPLHAHVLELHPRRLHLQVGHRRPPHLCPTSYSNPAQHRPWLRPNPKHPSGPVLALQS